MKRMPFKFSGKVMVELISGIGIIDYLSGRTMLNFYLIAYLKYIPDWLKNQM